MYLWNYDSISAYSCTQLAAVSAYLSEIVAQPQKCFDNFRNEHMNGANPSGRSPSAPAILFDMVGIVVI